MSLQLINQHSKYVKETCNQLEQLAYQKRTLVSSFERECKKNKIIEKLVIKESLHLREDERCIPGCQLIENEYAVVSKLAHENILSPILFEKQYRGGCSIYFPRASCDAFQYFIERSQKERKTVYTLCEVRDVIKSIALALNYLHVGENIAHNDIKLENILCFISEEDDHAVTYMLTDFGYSYEIDEKYKETPIDVYQRWQGRVRRYLSPEIVNQINSRSIKMGFEKQSDIISLGYALYILVFYDELTSQSEREFSSSKKYNRLQNEGVEFLKTLRSSLIDTELEKKDDLFDLIIKMTHKDPSKRINTSELLNHPWLQ